MLTLDLTGARTEDSYLRSYEYLNPEGGVFRVYFSTQGGGRTIELQQNDLIDMLRRDFERLSTPHLKGFERKLVQNEYRELLRAAGDFGPEIDKEVLLATHPAPDIVSNPALYGFAVKAEAADTMAAGLIRRHILRARGVQP